METGIQNMIEHHKALLYSLLDQGHALTCANVVFASQQIDECLAPHLGAMSCPEGCEAKGAYGKGALMPAPG